MSLIEKLRPHGTHTVTEPDTPIFLEGDPAGGVYGVVAGRVRIEVVTPTGGRLVLAVKESGDVFGELGALDGHPRSASAVVVDRAELLRVPVDAFLFALESEPALAVDLLRRLSTELRAADQRTAVRNSADTSTRLALQLTELCDRFGEHGGAHGTGIALTLTQDDLAGWIGATREATARSLRGLREAGCVVTGRRRITVVDLDRLRTLATGVAS